MYSLFARYAALAVLALPVAARGPIHSTSHSTRAAVPFAVGERMDYDVKFGILKVGTGSMEVAPMDTVRGREAWHTRFNVHGGTFFYRVDDRLESWMDVSSLASLRHVQLLSEGSRDRERRFEIYPDRGVFTESGKGGEQPTVPEPLDDGSFLYFLRTIPLEVGHQYTFDRYFRPDRNPVIVRVLRKERVTVPAGTFNAIVVQPIIRTKGIFSEGGQAQIWLSDDASRMMLQMKSKLSFGSLNLYLTSYRTPPTVATK